MAFLIKAMTHDGQPALVNPTHVVSATALDDERTEVRTVDGSAFVLDETLKRAQDTIRSALVEHKKIRL